MKKVFHLEDESATEMRRRLSLLSMRVRVSGGSVVSVDHIEEQSGRLLATVVCQIP